MARSSRYQQAKVDRDKENNAAEKKIRDGVRVFEGPAAVKEVTGKMPEGSKSGPTPVEDE